MVEGELSNEEYIILGVPHWGIVLDLLMTLIYINDPDNNIHSSVHLFTDD